MLLGARDSPVRSRRSASSRPSRCGIETTRGADIPNPFSQILLRLNAMVAQLFRTEATAANLGDPFAELSMLPLVLAQRLQCSGCRLPVGSRCIKCQAER